MSVRGGPKHFYGAGDTFSCNESLPVTIMTRELVGMSLHSSTSSSSRSSFSSKPLATRPTRNTPCKVREGSLWGRRKKQLTRIHVPAPFRAIEVFSHAGTYFIRPLWADPRSVWSRILSPKVNVWLLDASQPWLPGHPFSLTSQQTASYPARSSNQPQPSGHTPHVPPWSAQPPAPLPGGRYRCASSSCNGPHWQTSGWVVRGAVREMDEGTGRGTLSLNVPGRQCTAQWGKKKCYISHIQIPQLCQFNYLLCRSSE